jgi:hypothetical protein
MKPWYIDWLIGYSAMAVFFALALFGLSRLT